MTNSKKRVEARAVEKKVASSSVVMQAKAATETPSTPMTHGHMMEPTDYEEGQPVRRVPFRFLDLPSELRLRIYEEMLRVKTTIDLDPMNYRLILPRLSVLLVNRQVHEEAYRLFYSQTIRLFPVHGRFFHTKKPLLLRLSTRYRSAITSLELRIGPGWSAPPRGQKITPELGLADCTGLRVLHILVELDPSDQVFNGFRGKNATEDTYKDFCLELLGGVYERVPSLETVEIDAYPAVRKDAPMIVALRRQVIQYGKTLKWGPLRGWTKSMDEPGLIGLEQFTAGMDLSDSPRLVDVLA